MQKVHNQFDKEQRIRYYAFAMEFDDWVIENTSIPGDSDSTSQTINMQRCEGCEELMASQDPPHITNEPSSTYQAPNEENDDLLSLL